MCSLCEEYAARQAERPVAVMSCEGVCLRGEVPRRAANIPCDSIAPDVKALIGDLAGSARSRATR